MHVGHLLGFGDILLVAGRRNETALARFRHLFGYWVRLTLRLQLMLALVYFAAAVLGLRLLRLCCVAIDAL